MSSFKIGVTWAGATFIENINNTNKPSLIIDQALELDPNDADAYIGRGWAYSKLKEYQQAIADFDHGLKLDPDKTFAYEGRGWVYYSLKEYQQASADFDRLVEITAWGYVSRGNFYSQLKEYQRAIADFDRALKLNPNDTDAYSNRGWAYLWLRNIKQAKADFTRSCELDASLIRNRWIIIWIEMCQNRPDISTVVQLGKSPQLIHNIIMPLFVEEQRNT